MKWIENGIQFEGSVSEYKELHDLMDMVPQRKRSGRKVILTDQVKWETIEQNSLKDAAEYLTNATGTFISPKKLADVINKNERFGDFTAKYAEETMSQGDLMNPRGGDDE